MNCLHCGKQTGKPVKYCNKRCADNHYYKRKSVKWQKEKEELLKEIKAKGLVLEYEAAEMMGYKSTKTLRNNKEIPFVVLGEQYGLGKLYDKQDLLQAKENRQKKKEQTDNGNQALVKRKNLTDDEWNERKLTQKIVEVGPPPHVKNGKPCLLRNWNANAEMMRLYEEEGVVTKLPCKVCGESLPYWRFATDFGARLERNGRRWECKSCCNLTRRASPKKHSEDDLVTAFLKNFTISIRQELNLRQVKRCEMSGAEIWKKLEENLGYDKKKFLEHIKSQFEDWMNLNNRGRSMSLDNPNWQLDHIKPKSSFSYTSMEDEGFKECWGLPNLRPVETCINQIKGKCENLHEGAVRSFMRGLHDGRSGGAGGIWSYLSYSAQEARESLKKKMTADMNWTNARGKHWTIEHIISGDELPYESFRDENFKKIWALENLRPVLIKS